jgi:hypothetical protein
MASDPPPGSGPNTKNIGLAKVSQQLFGKAQGEKRFMELRARERGGPPNRPTCCGLKRQSAQRSSSFTRPCWPTWRRRFTASSSHRQCSDQEQFGLATRFQALASADEDDLSVLRSIALSHHGYIVEINPNGLCFEIGALHPRCHLPETLLARIDPASVQIALSALVNLDRVHEGDH